MEDNKLEENINQLRKVTESGLPIFYEQQLDHAADYVAAFTCKDPADRDSINEHWSKILADEAIPIKTILYDGLVAGSVLTYIPFSDREVSYWLEKGILGKGYRNESIIPLFG
jgi:hypothetical protein